MIGSDSVCPTCNQPVKPPRQQRDPARPRRTVSIAVPKDHMENGAEVLTTLLDECRIEVRADLGYQDDVPVYFVLTAVLADWLNGRKQAA